MNNMSKSFKNDEGVEETLIISSDDNRELKLNKTYTIANHKQPKESDLAKKFKGSILGADIGVKSGGFTNIAILATVIAVGAIAIMYFLWRF